MGKLNEIQEQSTQSWGDNSFTTKITNTTVEFDSAKDSFTFNDPVNVPELKINGTEIVAFDAEDRAKLDSLQTPMQIKGRVDSTELLPTDGVVVGSVYLVGLTGDENFEEYVCTEISGSPATPVWENLGHVKAQSDWSQSNSSADNYIKNKPTIKAGQGVNSITEGDGTTASGPDSHAEGMFTTASGTSSHTEGNGTKASEQNSHAEGAGTTASGPQSHAEGAGTTASGYASHAEGYGGTTASGYGSHAEGCNTTASEQNSHAEGNGTKASEQNSHAEGNGTKASGGSSHAEGNRTTSSGYASHAEGQGTTAIGPFSHAEGGNGTTASGTSSHAEGVGTTASAESSHAEGGNGTTASGTSSHAEGVGTTASSYCSHAEGTNTTASGWSSHTEGSSTTATGDLSHTEGNGTIANNKCQHVFGEYNGVDPSSALSSARGTYIEIVGNGAKSSARSNARTLDWSGNEVLAGNLTIGGTITANGQQILPQKQADWNQTTSTESDYIKNKPVIPAAQVQADWIQSDSESLDFMKNKPAIKAGQGVNSIVEGVLGGNSSSGDYSHAEGAGTTASKYCSHAEGSGTTASGSGSHAEGGSTTASGNCSHAEGDSTTVSGNASHAEGKYTTASGDSSHTEGSYTIAKNRSQHVFGEYNIADPSTEQSFTRGNYVEIVGKGTSSGARSNARTLDWSGNEVLAGNLTIGGTITANGQQILPQVQSDWNQTTSTESDYIKNKPVIKAGQGVNSIVEGDLTENSSAGNYSHTEGVGTTANGIAAHTEGVGTTASGDVSHAEGNETIANHKCQHVFGEFNELDPNVAASDARGNYVEIVGRGTDVNTRSNARTLDWDGNEVLTGTLTIGGVSGATLKVESGALKVSFDGGTTWLTMSAS